MPTSAPYAIPVIVHAARQVRPRSVLDVGVGFGKYGMLFREYLDIFGAIDLAHYQRSGWRTCLEGIEVFPKYLTPLHDFLYDRVHVGNALQVIDTLGSYDLIFMGDVIEHFEKPDGQALIRKLYDHADRCVLLTYPAGARPRDDALFGNIDEAHRSQWSRRDFRDYPRVASATVEDRAEVVALAKPPHEVPFLVGCLAARRRNGWKGTLATALVRAMGPTAASSIASRLLGRRVALRAE